jgi:hypothetical protein
MAATIGFPSGCELVIASGDDHTRFWPTRLAPMGVRKKPDQRNKFEN